MVTFNIDSLDFSDDEEARFGAAPDFGLSYDSGNSRLELEDITNATFSHIPTGRSGDLVGGRISETVAEGKALADDGNVYDTIQAAENAASSWVKVGPGTFNESVTINTPGLTFEGSGTQTQILPSDVESLYIDPAATNVSIGRFTAIEGNGANNEDTPQVKSGADDTIINNLYVKSSSKETWGLEVNANSPLVNNVTAIGPSDISILVRNGTNGVISDCFVDGEDVSTGRGRGIQIDNNDSVVANNISKNISAIDGSDLRAGGITVFSNDAIIIGNRIDTTQVGISLGTVIDNIIANNNISNTSLQGIDNTGTTGTVLDANLTG